MTLNAQDDIKNKDAAPLSRQVTPVHIALGGSAILLGGAFITGSAHYASTAKKLAEDGILPQARRKAMPIALQAFAMSTLVCIGVATTALGAWHFIGLESRPIAHVSTFSDAVALAKQQREIVRNAFQSTLFVDETADTVTTHPDGNSSINDNNIK